MALAVLYYQSELVFLHCATKAFANLSETVPCVYPAQPSLFTEEVVLCHTDKMLSLSSMITIFLADG